MPNPSTLPAAVRETAPPYRPALVDINTVVALWSLPPATVLALIEESRIRWAWDVSLHQGPRREIRIWVRELYTPEAVRTMDVRAVVDAVIGHPSEPRLRATTVERLLMVPRPTVHHLVEAGELKGAVEDRTLWITRASLVAFLGDRVLSAPCNPATAAEPAATGSADGGPLHPARHNGS